MRVRYLVPVAAGVAVFGAVTAFAATLNVSSTSLGAGNASVASCNASASVTYNTAYDSTIPGYQVTTAPVTTAAGCATKSYKVSLLDSSNAAIAEVTGTLDGTGSASPDFTTNHVNAGSVAGVSVVITG